MYKIKKQDDLIEDYDKNKIVNGVVKSGGSPEDAQKVLQEVENWLPSVAVDETVSSTDIKNKVLEILERVNPTAATNFLSYRKPGSN